MLYNEDAELKESFERTVLKRYGGFFRLNPPNTPVHVKVRIYVVKASLSPIRDNGMCDPYLAIRIGDRQVEDVASTRQNTTDPIFGWFVSNLQYWPSLTFFHVISNKLIL
jgi:hypothetical protein